jgi:hypothetical protein
LRPDHVEHVDVAVQIAPQPSSYLLSQINDQGQYIMRIRGVAFISDPNDLAQLIVRLIPLLFFFWSKGSALEHASPPCVGALLFGIYLTHSRGAIVAFLAVVIVAAGRKIGTIPAGIIAEVLFEGITALNWSGGRGISAEAGSDRMASWGTGLMLIRSHPRLRRQARANRALLLGTVYASDGPWSSVHRIYPKRRAEAARDEVLQQVAPGMMASAEPAPMPDRSGAGSLYQEAVAASPYLMIEEEQETLPEETRRLAVVVCFTGSSRAGSYPGLM